MIDEDELRRMSVEERQELARVLAKIELPHFQLDPDLVRRRRMGLLVMTTVTVILAGWIAILALTLHQHFTVRHWSAVWVGFDIAELAAFGATAWAAWKQRQIVIMLMIVTGTLLVCDAWFDLALDYGSSDFILSVISAVFAELPLAFMLLNAARRLVRLSVYSLMRLQGVTGTLPPLHRVPLFAEGIGEAIPRRLRGPVTQSSGVSSQSGS